MLNAGNDLIISFFIDLSNEIKIEKRVVTSFPSIFGEIFGLYEFMATFAILIVGKIPAKLNLLD